MTGMLLKISFEYKYYNVGILNIISSVGKIDTRPRSYPIVYYGVFIIKIHTKILLNVRGI